MSKQLFCTSCGRNLAGHKDKCPCGVPIPKEHEKSKTTPITDGPDHKDPTFKM